MTLDQQLHSDFGPLLSDGMTVPQLVDTEYREVSMRLLSDPEIYQLELKHLFAKVWTLVGHEDEIPKPNDYVTRYVGEDQVIVNRGKDGSINVLLNVCSHRGVHVCRGEAGSAPLYKCPYHSWTYSIDGSLLSTPVAKQQMHGTLRPKSELGMQRARVELYAGMIFATFDDTAPTLEEYLGPITWYYDLIWKRRESGMTVLGPPQRFIVPANWKCAAEQAAGDVFHGMNLHRSLFEVAGMTIDSDFVRGTSASWGGHFMHCFDVRKAFVRMAPEEAMGQAKTPIELMRVLPPPGLSVDMVDDLEQRFDADQLRVLAEMRPTVGNTFPNTMLFAFPQVLPTGDMGAVVSWRVFVPRGPDKFEMFNWFLVERDASEKLVDQVRLSSAMQFGSSGMTECDDADTWPMQTQVARGALGRERKLRYQAVLGDNKPDDWPGPGHVYSGFVKDDMQWNWWLRYLDFMAGRPWG